MQRVGMAAWTRWTRVVIVVVVLATVLMAQFGRAQASGPGTVVAWGYNAQGQTNVPSDLNGVTAIAAGNSLTVALKSDGTVIAWGDNYYGEINFAAGLSSVTAVSIGNGFTAALKSDGTVVAWGFNGAGQTSVPAGLSDIIAIAAGRQHIVALTSDGTVVAWGDNIQGQRNVPAGLSGVTAIAAGNSHSVALKRDGTVVAWGCLFADYGQCSVPAGLSDVTAIAAGGFNTVALKSDGTVVAWGFNGAGQTSVPAGLSDVTAIAAGGGHMLALKSDGTVVAWGFNGVGQRNVPTGLSGVTAIAAGDSHSVALIGSRDTSAPTASPSQTPAANAAGWNNGPVTVSWNWTDNAGGDGIDPANCTTTSTSSGEGTLTLSATCTDLAGNTGTASASVNVDTTAPTVTASPDRAPNASGWHNASVTIAFSCNDALSGVASCPANQTLSGEGSAISSLAQAASDLAGNTSAPSNVVTAKIDKTAPTLAPSVSPNPVRQGQSATASAGATDALAGIATQSCDPATTSTPGTKTLTCTATDTAGNTSSTSVSYTVLPSFPYTSVLDTFDRANGKVGGSWEGLTSTDFYKIAANSLDVQVGGPLVWKPTSFGTTQEAFVKLSTIDAKNPSQGLLLKVQTGSVPIAGAISVVYDAKAKAVRVSALRLERNGAWTLYPNQSATFANGDVLGARASADGTIAIYKNGAQIASVTLNAQDQAFFNAKGGKIGIWTVAASNAVLDDFGGGTVV